MSIILGTVAFSYGSVPMYKMVSPLLTPLNYPNERNLTFLQRRSAKPPAGAVNPSSPLRTATPPTPQLGSSPSPTTNASASRSTAPSLTCCPGNSRPSSAKSESCLAKLPWRSIPRRTNRRKTSLVSLPIALRRDRWRRTSARSNVSALRSRG
jgi:hypothetical protein